MKAYLQIYTLYSFIIIIIIIGKQLIKRPHTPPYKYLFL